MLIKKLLKLKKKLIAALNEDTKYANNNFDILLAFFLFVFFIVLSVTEHNEINDKISSVLFSAIISRINLFLLLFFLNLLSCRKRET